MPDFQKLDDEARAELLTYLVVSQLIGRARTAEWLKPGQLVESERTWRAANGGHSGWAESLQLATGLPVATRKVLERDLC
jgi:hypothetical protein